MYKISIPGKNEALNLEVVNITRERLSRVNYGVSFLASALETEQPGITREQINTPDASATLSAEGPAANVDPVQPVPLEHLDNLASDDVAYQAYEQAENLAAIRRLVDEAGDGGYQRAA